MQVSNIQLRCSFAQQLQRLANCRLSLLIVTTTAASSLKYVNSYQGIKKILYNNDSQPNTVILRGYNGLVSHFSKASLYSNGYIY